MEVKERAFTSYQLLLSIGLPPSDNGVLVPASTIASKCRAASSMLTYLLTPEPMKPISAKAQKRKLAEGPPSPISVQEWEQDVDWDAFSSILFEETPWFDKDGNVKGSPESICFTKQQAKSAPTQSRGGTAVEGFMGIDAVGLPAGGTETLSFGTTMAGGGFDSATGQAPSTSHQREGDPFYLSSSAAPAGRLFDTARSAGDEKVAKDAAEAAATRFGSIQLDSGGESDDGYSGMKSKKKKKKKVKKAAATNHQKLVESDDDDDDHVPQPKRGSANKEFQNLALVDLTTPLGEDEVMPRNEHYVVPERPVIEQKPASKKPKKKKAKTKTKKSSQMTEAAEGDLLGFDAMAFGSASGAVTAGDSNAKLAVATEALPSTNNPINNAFDDLLGLEMPQPIESSNTMVQTVEALPDEKATKSNKVKKQKKEKKKKSKKGIE